MPDQFWKLTFTDLEELLDAHRQRERKEWRKLAQLACWVTAPHLKKPLTVDKLVKDHRSKAERRISKEEKEKVLAELEAMEARG